MVGGAVFFFSLFRSKKGKKNFRECRISKDFSMSMTILCSSATEKKMEFLV